MRTLTVLLIVVLVLSACSTGPTADQIAATVNAQVASTLAAVPTNTPKPTNTPVPTATNTPAPAETPQVILDAQSIMEGTNAWLKEEGVPAEIIDVKYESGLNQVNNILHVHIKSTAAQYDSTVAVNVILMVARAIRAGLEFEGNLTALNITAYDSMLNDQGLMVVDWQDMVDYAHGQITPEQLALRVHRFP